ncbi:MAG TPA: hypothetical protein VFS75_03695 [Candidatus Paceibacterota bacterium]|nr:hypothetical protein [Candidatus Paceibacterota bacterium]
MNKNHWYIGIALVLTFLLLTLADLVPFWMPMMWEMTALLIAVVLLLAWAGFVLKEGARDEREALLTLRSGRVAYLAGLGVLMVALVVQCLGPAPTDPWVAITLSVMVLAKLFTRAREE